MKRTGGALLSSITIDPTSPRKVSTQLYMGLRDIILSGGVLGGERLPASRTLATDLGVSRTTVINALDRLTAEGLLEARTGAGTFVSRDLEMERPAVRVASPEAERISAPQLSQAAARATRQFAPRARLPHSPRAFVTGLPALDAFPMEQWTRIASKHWRGLRGDVMGYGEPYGLPQLRRAISSHVNASRGVHCAENQIFIVSGAQHAFQLIGAMLLNAGDRVWFENPGATGARNSFVASGADLVPVDVDENGLDVRDGMRKAPDFRLAFVTPSHQQPLGAVMSLRRRLALLKAAEDADAWIVEDDYDSEFHFGGQPLPTLKSVDTAGRVIYVGTFSKSLFPSLRLGFVLAPPGLVESFERLSRSYLQGVPTSLQAIVAEFMQEGHFATHVRRMRRIYAARHAALREAADAELTGLLDVQPTLSGLHTVGYFPERRNEAEIAETAARRGVTVAPLGRYCIAPIEKTGLVLGFGCVDAGEIRAAVPVLRGILQGQEHSSESRV